VIVLCGEISRSNSSKDSSNHNKDDIINVTKAVVRKFILMQITARAKAANGFH
jgi:NADPH-dependent curcumin reductase CurA